MAGRTTKLPVEKGKKEESDDEKGEEKEAVITEETVREKLAVVANEMEEEGQKFYEEISMVKQQHSITRQKQGWVVDYVIDTIKKYIREAAAKDLRYVQIKFEEALPCGEHFDSPLTQENKEAILKSPLFVCFLPKYLVSSRYRSHIGWSFTLPSFP